MTGVQTCALPISKPEPPQPVLVTKDNYFTINPVNTQWYKEIFPTPETVDTKDFGNPAINQDCSVMRWMIRPGGGPLAVRPLHCSEGGYDLCPPVVKCFDKNHKWNFKVHFYDSGFMPKTETDKILPKVDVVMPDGNFGPNPKLSASWEQPKVLPHQTLSCLSMESGVYHPGSRGPVYAAQVCSFLTNYSNYTN